MIFQRFVGTCVVPTLVLAPALLFVPLTGWAQVEEIIVTARRREESLQEIPLAITAFTAETLQRRGIRSLDDLARNTAGLVFDNGIVPQDTRVVIRGLSPTRGRQNIAFRLDGIDISSESINTAGGSLLVNPRYLDYERVEIVKGPQSALYGRAAFNGAINYITKRPGDSFTAEFNVDGSSASDSDTTNIDVFGAIGGPITDTFGLRASVAAWDEDGYYNNPFTADENLGGGDGYGVALSGLWTPSDTFDLNFRVSYSDDSYEQRPAAFVDYNTITLLHPDIYSPNWINSTYTGPLDAMGNIPDRTDPNDPNNIPANYTYEVCGKAQNPDGSDTTPPAGSDFAQCANEAINWNPSATDNRTVRIFEFAPGQFNDPEIIGPTGATPAVAYHGEVPDTKDLKIRLSPDPKSIPEGGCSASNPNCGNDYPGTDIEVFRTSLVMNWQVGGGTISSWTGVTTAEQNVALDFDKYAVAPGDNCLGNLGIACDNVFLGEAYNHEADPLCLLTGGDCAWGTMQNASLTETDQFNQELRYASSFDGPMNFSAGAQYWKEEATQIPTTTTALAVGGTTGNVATAGPDGLLGGPPGPTNDNGPTGAGNFPNCANPNLIGTTVDAGNDGVFGGYSTGPDGIPGTDDDTFSDDVGVANPAFQNDFRNFTESGELLGQRFVLEQLSTPGWGPTATANPGVNWSPGTGYNSLCPPNSSPILQYLGTADPNFDQRTFISPRNFVADTDSWSLYGKLDLDLSAKWRFSVEGRYVNEVERQTQPEMAPEADQRQSPSSVSPVCQAGRNTNTDRICNDPIPLGFDPVTGDPLYTSPPYIPGGVSTPNTTAGPFLTPPTQDVNVSTRTQFFVPRAALEWRPVDDQMYYLSYAVGKKPGGFSRLTAGSGGFTPDEAIFKEETLTVYELGAKTMLFDHTLQLNSAFYFQDFEDKQVPTTLINERTGLSGGAVLNAGEAEIWGLELEAAWAPTDRLSFSLAYTWLDAEYTDFDLATDSRGDLTDLAKPYDSTEFGIATADSVIPEGALIGTDCPVSQMDPQSGVGSTSGLPDVDLQCVISLAGHKIEDVPEHSLNLNGLYRAPFFSSGLEWFVEAEYVFQDQRFVEQWNNRWLDSYQIVDARFGLGGERWEAIFYIDNLFEDTTVRSAQTGPGISSGFFFAGAPRVRDQMIAYPAPPRVFGLRFAYRIGN